MRSWAYKGGGLTNGAILAAVLILDCQRAQAETRARSSRVEVIAAWTR